MDIEGRKIVKSIDLGKGLRPHCPITCAKTGLVYITTENENSVSILDPKTMTITGTIPTGHPESHMLAITSDGKTGYTANVASGTVSVLDLEGKKLVKSIQAAARTQRISVSVDNKWAFTSDQVQQRLVVINTATNEVEKYIDLPDYGYGTASTPDG